MIDLIVEPLRPGRFRAGLDRRLALDLEPQEFAGLQGRGLLVRRRGELEIRTTPNGAGDQWDCERSFEPDTSKAANLLSRYRHADL